VEKMTTKNVLLDYPKPGIARLTLNRPEKNNAFNPELIRELKQSLVHCESDPSIHILILSAKSPHFSAGADLQWMKDMAMATQEENRADAMVLADLLFCLKQFAKPTIARIQGAAIGGGVGLIACCDLAIAEENSYFCFSEVKIGLIPAIISPYILQAIGERAARRYFLTAEKIPAKTAMELGLIHECVSADMLDTRLNHWIETLEENSPDALKACKKLISDVSTQPFNQDLVRYTANTIADIRVSPSAQEGLRAFLEKRKPIWRS
jgi:methylglutaconyl-CoA hydratase